MSRRAVPLLVGALSVASLVAVAPPAQAATSCAVTYAVGGQWPSGFQGALEVTNTGDAWNGWTLTFGFPNGQTVSQGWNATYAQSGTTVTASNVAWNGAVGTGSTVTAGFLGSWNNSVNGPPTSFAVNGVTCGGPTQPTTTTTQPTTTTTTTTRPTTTTTTTQPTTTTTTTTTRPTTTTTTTQPTTTTTTTRTTTTTTTTQPTTTTTTTRPTTTTTTQPTTTTTTSATGVLAQVHTVGRVKDNGSSVQFTWPGTTFEGQFRGTGVGIVLNDSQNDYDVLVDGALVTTLVTPGRVTHWVSNLSNAEHTVRLVKRTESPWAVGEFGGFLPASGGQLLSKPAARTRQIEFIGDSFTAGYGNMSTSRDCSATGVTRKSNADQSFAALAARSLGADEQTLAWSGRGMVRNYAGSDPTVNFRTYYDQTLQALYNSTVWQNPGTWKPQLVVVGLGINDFSTALGSGEKWSSASALAADYTTSYLGFLDKLRSRYGQNTVIVVSTTSYGSSAFTAAATQVVQTRRAQGDSKVVLWDYSNAGLDFLGCDWHPSANDDQILARALGSFVATLPLNW